MWSRQITPPLWVDQSHENKKKFPKKGSVSAVLRTRFGSGVLSLQHPSWLSLQTDNADNNSWRVTSPQMTDRSKNHDASLRTMKYTFVAICGSLVLVLLHVCKSELSTDTKMYTCCTSTCICVLVCLHVQYMYVFTLFSCTCSHWATQLNSPATVISH